MCKNLGGYPVRPMSQADIDALNTLTSYKSYWIGAKGDPNTLWRGRWTSTCPPNTTDYLGNTNFRWWPNSDLSSTFSPPVADINNQAFYFDGIKQKFLPLTSSYNTFWATVCEKNMSNGKIFKCLLVLPKWMWLHLDCPEYQIKNGYTKTCDGMIAYAYCDTGFYLVGDDPRICSTNSFGDYWNTDAQQCHSKVFYFSDFV